MIWEAFDLAGVERHPIPPPCSPLPLGGMRRGVAHPETACLGAWDREPQGTPCSIRNMANGTSLSIDGSEDAIAGILEDLPLLFTQGLHRKRGL